MGVVNLCHLNEAILKNIIIVYYVNTDVLDEFKTENKELLSAIADQGIGLMYVQNDDTAGCHIAPMVIV